MQLIISAARADSDLIDFPTASTSNMASALYGRKHTFLATVTNGPLHFDSKSCQEDFGYRYRSVTARRFYLR